MENKVILNVLNRLHSEKAKDIKKLSERLSTLGHQLRYFNEMPECSQNLVIDKMFEDMINYGWNDWMNEVKEEIKQ